VAGTAPIRSLDLVRSGTVMELDIAPDRTELELDFTLVGLEAGEYLYLRIVQQDGGVAWSSPWFIR
jgi:hypothetical protein